MLRNYCVFTFDAAFTDYINTFDITLQFIDRLTFTLNTTCITTTRYFKNELSIKLEGAACIVV